MPDIQTLDLDIRRSLQVAAETRTDNSLSTAIDRFISKPKVGKLDPLGEAEGVIGRPDQFDKSYHASTVILVKDIAGVLCNLYPDWAWAVQPQEFGQVINVFCLQLHTEFGYTIRMADIMNDPRRREAVKAGHEILRRFGMPNRFNAVKVAEMPRDMRGQGIPDISDFADKKMIRDTEIARKRDSGEWQIVEADGHGYLRAKK